jgi:hypothetical protein
LQASQQSQLPVPWNDVRCWSAEQGGVADRQSFAKQKSRTPKPNVMFLTAVFDTTEMHRLVVAVHGARHCADISDNALPRVSEDEAERSGKGNVAQIFAARQSDAVPNSENGSRSWRRSNRLQIGDTGTADPTTRSKSKLYIPSPANNLPGARFLDILA